MSESEQQQETKKRASSLSSQPTKKAKKVKTKYLDPKILELRRTIQLSCGSNNLHKAIEAYERLHIKESVMMEPQSYYNLMNLCEGLTDRQSVHIGTPKNPKASFKEKETEIEPIAKEYTLEERRQYAFQLKKEMDEINLPLTENAYTALIRILCKSHDIPEAIKLLDQAEATQQCKPKLRMYSSIISLCCDVGDLDGALSIWARMSSIQRKNKKGTEVIVMEPTEKEYCAIMKCATMLGDVKVMDRVLGDLAEDVLIPSLETTDAIVSWFRSEHSSRLESNTCFDSALDRVKNLPDRQSISLGPLQALVQSDFDRGMIQWEVSNDVPIDCKTGTLKSGCLAGKTLKPVPVTSDAWKAMLEMNERIVLKGELEEHGKRTEFAGGGKGKKRIVDQDQLDKRKQYWKEFLLFLEEKYGKLYNEEEAESSEKKLDFVIDGANIGYYKQNFAKSPKHVDYNQIDAVIQHIEKQNKSVLVFLHSRHFTKKMMPHWAEKIVNRWEEKGILYRTPFGSNDDWFWMHAALWCGRHTFVLSNDEMRDHHFQMCAHRMFLRWKERQQVHFDIFGGRKIDLFYPDMYSRRIQKLDEKCLVIPKPKRGDENRFLDGAHEADESAPIKETYVCIKQRNS